ncbi:MAG: hypothetical protein M0P01_11550 [Treponema sp.]|nr:hypothetical protein [Treponema sp.]
MANFNVTIDTQPMAQSIDTVNGHVENVTGAVVAMQSAVVAEELSASRQICSNVDNGFFILMKSQLSQKIASCSSIMSSKLMLMKKFRSDILHIQVVMQEDYNRICRRYHLQFIALDKALEARIRELDRAAMEIAAMQKRMFGKLRDDSSCTICYDYDTQFASEKSVTAKVKRKTEKALDAMTCDVEESIMYNRKVGHILRNSIIPAKEEVYIPVVLAETDSMYDTANKVSSVYTADTGIFSNADEVSNQVQSSLPSFRWTPVAKEEHDQVQNAFMQRCSSSKIDDRVTKEMIRLFNESSWAVPVSDGGSQ